MEYITGGTLMDLKERDSLGSGWLYSVSLMADLPVSELLFWLHCLHRWPNNQYAAVDLRGLRRNAASK